MLLDALGDAGYVLDTPGALARGVLAGRPGGRASGEELLDAWGLPGGPLGGFAAEMALDPLALAGPALGAYKGLRGLAGLGRADDLNPLLRRLGELGGADPFDALRAGYRGTVGQPTPVADALGRFAGDETGALGPGAAKLADEVASDPWFYRSYAPGFHPDRVDPLQFPTRLRHDGEVGNVRGVAGLSPDPEELIGRRSSATDAQVLRDLTFGEHPVHGGHIGFDPAADNFELANFWHDTFPESGLNPALFEAQVEPRGVLDLRKGAPATNVGALAEGFLDRVWEMRQRAARALGLDWPAIEPRALYGGDAGRIEQLGQRLAGWSEHDPAKQKLNDLIDPHGTVVGPELWGSMTGTNPILSAARPFEFRAPQQRMSHLGTANHDLLRALEYVSPELWNRTGDEDIAALLRMGANQDPLRHFLAEQGYDAILGDMSIPPWGAGSIDAIGTTDPVETMLNILDPRAIKSWDRIG